MQSICIIGIDTDIGKTLVTGLLARSAAGEKRKVSTMKPVQTGCTGGSEDIAEHRRLMGIDLQDYDEQGLSCPYLFKKPCSPALAAELEGCSIDIGLIKSALRNLEKMSELVLVEGAGGLMVPLNKRESFLDLLVCLELPVILVTNNKLGSINHTLLTLDVLSRNNVKVLGMVYNIHFNDDELITQNTKKVLADAMTKYGFNNIIAEIATVERDAAQAELDIKQFLDVSS